MKITSQIVLTQAEVKEAIFLWFKLVKKLDASQIESIAVQSSYADTAASIILKSKEDYPFVVDPPRLKPEEKGHDYKVDLDLN